MNSDQIEADGKNCFLHPTKYSFFYIYKYLLKDGFVDDTDDGQTFNFGKNLLCEIVSDAFGPN
jgi:hypothetical protein